MSLAQLFRNDQSAWVLLGSNLITIFLALTQQWNLVSLMLLFWIQSSIIGFFTVLKMLSLKSFSTKGFSSNGVQVPEKDSAKIGTAVFFSLHYGFFHFVYLLFLLVFMWGSYATVSKDFTWILVAGIIFFFNHLFSFVYNKKDLENQKPNLGQMMFTPYARIIPMHLTIIFGGIFFFDGSGGSNPGVLLLFLGLKTAGDLLMHFSEHHSINSARIKDNGFSGDAESITSVLMEPVSDPKDENSK